MLFAKTSQTAKQLIINSIELYKASLSRVLVVSFVAALLTTVVNNVPKFVNLQQSMTSTHWLVFVAMILSVFIVCYAAIIMMHQMMSIGRDERVPLHRSIAYAHSRVLRLTLAMICVYFVTALGMILFIIPGIIAVVLTSMVMPLVIFKNLRPFTAFKASFELVWGNAWRTFAVIITPNVLIFVILTVAKLLHLPDMLLGVVEVFTMFLAGPWVYCAVLVMYNDLMLLHYNRKQA